MWVPRSKHRFRVPASCAYNAGTADDRRSPRVDALLCLAGIIMPVRVDYVSSTENAACFSVFFTTIRAKSNTMPAIRQVVLFIYTK